MPWWIAFLKSLKYELIYGNNLLSAEQIDLEIFENIEIFYNKNQTTLGAEKHDHR